MWQERDLRTHWPRPAVAEGNELAIHATSIQPPCLGMEDPDDDRLPPLPRDSDRRAQATQADAVDLDRRTVLWCVDDSPRFAAASPFAK